MTKEQFMTEFVIAFVRNGNYTTPYGSEFNYIVASAEERWKEIQKSLGRNV